MTIALCLICSILGMQVGWFARELRDLLKSMLEIYRKLHYQNNKTARAAVITGGHVFSQGKEHSQDEVVLEDFDVTTLPPTPKSGVVRRPSPEVARAAQEKAHKDALTDGE